MSGRKQKEEIELFYSYLRQNGLKKTYQKDLILEIFLDTEGHLSVEDIYALVKKKDKKVGIVTVFRTLKSLTACGIAREITLGDGLTRFEHSYHHPHHHHIVCTECHKAIEFVSPELERIQMEIIRKYHFQPIHHRFQTYGICEDCREHRPIREVPKQDTERIFARDALKMAIAMVSRGLEFYREAALRNQDPAGREILQQVAGEKEKYLEDLQAKLVEMHRQETGLDHAPLFLHFESAELDALVPTPEECEVAGELRMDARRSLELVMALQERAAGFFRAYADKFLETEGKMILLHFAQAETQYRDVMAKRLEAMLATA